MRGPTVKKKEKSGDNEIQILSYISIRVPQCHGYLIKRHITAIYDLYIQVEPIVKELPLYTEIQNPNLS